MPNRPEPVAAPPQVGPDAQHEPLWRDGDLYVVEAACTFSAGREAADIVLACDNPSLPSQMEELKSVAARNLALAYAAARGVANVSQGGSTVVRPEPYNRDGVALADVSDDAGKPLSPRDPRMQVAFYRATVRAVRRPV